MKKWMKQERIIAVENLKGKSEEVIFHFDPQINKKRAVRCTKLLLSAGSTNKQE